MLDDEPAVRLLDGTPVSGTTIPSILSLTHFPLPLPYRALLQRVTPAEAAPSIPRWISHSLFGRRERWAPCLLRRPFAPPSRRTIEIERAPGRCAGSVSRDSGLTSSRLDGSLCRRRERTEHAHEDVHARR
jgi:hypothetical protein